MSRNWRHFNSFASRAKESYTKWKTGATLPIESTDPPLTMNERLKGYANDTASMVADVIILYGKKISKYGITYHRFQRSLSKSP